MRARRHITIGLALTGVLALAACGSGGSKATVTPTVTATVTQTVTATPSTSASVSSTPTPTATATPASCTTTALTARVGNPGAGAGQRYASIIVKNVLSRPCTLYGYPGLQLRTAAGRNVPTTVVRNQSPKPKLVTLAAGASASAAISFGVVPTGSEPQTGDCEPNPSSVLVIPPNRTTALTARWTLGPVCDKGRINVDAFVPGLGS